MRRLLVVLVLLVAVAVGVGYWRGWITFSTGGTDGQPNATVTLDQDKIKADAEAAKEKVQGIGQKARTGAADDTAKEGPSKP